MKVSHQPLFYFFQNDPFRPTGQSNNAPFLARHADVSNGDDTADVHGWREVGDIVWADLASAERHVRPDTPVKTLGSLFRLQPAKKSANNDSGLAKVVFFFPPPPPLIAFALPAKSCIRASQETGSSQACATCLWWPFNTLTSVDVTKLIWWSPAQNSSKVSIKKKAAGNDISSATKQENNLSEKVFLGCLVEWWDGRAVTLGESVCKILQWLNAQIYWAFCEKVNRKLAKWK